MIRILNPVRYKICQDSVKGRRISVYRRNNGKNKRFKLNLLFDSMDLHTAYHLPHDGYDIILRHFRSYAAAVNR